MFKRLAYESWIEWIPIVAFALTFGLFCIFVVRALRMRKGDIDHMAELPLEGAKGNNKKNSQDLNHE